MEKTMEKIVALAKSRGFVYPGSEISESFFSFYRISQKQGFVNQILWFLTCCSRNSKLLH